MSDNIELYLDSLVDNIAGHVYWKNREGVYLGCNTTVVMKGGFKTKAEVVNKTDYELWPEKAEAIRKTDLEVMRLNKVVEQEEFVVLKDGKSFYFSSIKAPLRDKHGNIVGVIGNSVDITALKIAQKNAETANLAKTQFLALMSHEIRLALTGVVSAASLLAEDDTLNEDAQKLVHTIENSSQYLLSTLNGILDFAKLEADKFELVLGSVDLPTLLEELTSLFRVDAQKKGLCLILRSDALIPAKIITDARVLRHIFTNLLSNAIKFTEQGEVVIQAHCVEYSANTIKIKVSIMDTGIGIPADKLDIIFDRFSQLADTYVRKDAHYGSGLGLSFVKRLVHLIGGTLQVYSEIGKGSEFHVTMDFPLSIMEK